MKLIEELKTLVEQKVPEHNKKLEKVLSEEELHTYTKLCEHSFNDNSWYRPAHNFIVTAAMLAICKRDGLNRKMLMPAAILHDIGYSFMTLDNLKISSDERREHCRIGAEQTSNILTELATAGKVSYTAPEISTISNIVLTHDNPYLGLPLNTDLERQHRDADRSFVPSLISYYKDFVKNKKDHASLNPHEFLDRRIAGFYGSPDQNPLQATHPLNRDLAQHNSGGLQVPHTKTAQKIIDQFLISRSKEKSMEHGMDSDAEYLLELAR